MAFKHKTDQALNEWVGTYTSETEHGEDEARKFYCFVSQYLQDHGYKMNQRAMNDAIKGMIRQRGFALGKAQEQRLRARYFSGSDS
jgi:hypothetical protein